MFETGCRSKQNFSQKLHSIVSRSAATFWYNPVDILRRILDITSLAMDAVLCIDLQLFPIAAFDWYKFVDASRAKSTFWTVVNIQVGFNGNSVVLEGQMGRLIAFMIRSGESHGCQEVEADFSVWFGVVDGFTVFGWF